MRPGPLAFGLFVLTVLCAVPTAARAAEDASSDDPPSLCMRGEPERTSLISAPLAAFTSTLARARSANSPAPAGDPLVCVKRGLGFDCQMHDPANRPAPTSFQSFVSPLYMLAAALELPLPDAARVSLAPGVLGAAHPGFARGLFRPPRA